MSPSDLSSSSSSSFPTFRTRTERHFPSPHKLEAWCPTADLLAIVNHHNDLQLYRLSWQQHWSVPIRAKPEPKPQGRMAMFPGFHRPQAAASGKDRQPSAVSLAWRPDGKVMAVGLANGQINIYDYRDGSLITTIEPTSLARLPQKLPMSRIKCLIWTDIYLGRPQQPPFFQAHRYPRSVLEALPLLSAIPLSSAQQQMALARSMFKRNAQGGAAAESESATSGMSKDEGGDVPDEESNYIMNVLFAGDDRGQLKVQLFGGFEVQTVSLPELLQKSGHSGYQSMEILKADIQLDLSEMTIVALGTRGATTATTAPPSSLLTGDLDAPVGSVMQTELVQVTISSALLVDHAQEIRAIGLKRRPVNHLLTYLAEGLEVMKSDYRKISQGTEDCVESVQQALNTNGESTDPGCEFIQLLMTGRPSVSLDQYLQHDLGHHGIKRWEKATKAAYANIQRVAFECLLPACERLILHISDLLGYSRCKERYGELGLCEKDVYNCIRMVGDFMGLIERLFQVLKVEMKQFHEFENWMEQVLEMLQPTVRPQDDQADDQPKIFPPVDILGVSGYLKAGLTDAGLGDFFKEEEETVQGQGSEMKETVVVGYNAVEPQYPITFSFSDDLERISKEVAVLSQQKQRQQQQQLRPGVAQGLGSWVKSSKLGSRGGAGGLVPSKSSMSLGVGAAATLSRPLASAALAPASASPTHLVEKPLTQMRSLDLGLDSHLKRITMHCRGIFEEPAKVVAKSLKVSQAVELLQPPYSSYRRQSKEGKEACGVIGDDGGIAAAQERTARVSADLKCCSRYCYQSTQPWHYLAVYLRQFSGTSESVLCILRTRKCVPGGSSRGTVDSSGRKGTHGQSNTEQEGEDQDEDAVGSGGAGHGVKRKAGDVVEEDESHGVVSERRRGSGVPGRVLRNKLSPTRAESTATSALVSSGTPFSPSSVGMDRLTLTSPKAGDSGTSSTTFTSTPSSSSASFKAPPLPIPSSCGGGGAGMMESEVAFFSLRDDGSGCRPTLASDGSRALPMDQYLGSSGGGGGSGGRFFDVWDLTFFDDDTLGLLLSSGATACPISHSPHFSSMALPQTSENHPQQLSQPQHQYLVTVPLQSRGRPFTPVQISASAATTAAIGHEKQQKDDKQQGALLDELLDWISSSSSFLPDRRSGFGTSSSSIRTTLSPSPPLALFTLPIAHSKFVGSSSTSIDGSSSSPPSSSFSTCSSSSEFSRIAYNERGPAVAGSCSVVSLHEPLTATSSSSSSFEGPVGMGGQAAGSGGGGAKITVFGF